MVPEYPIQSATGCRHYRGFCEFLSCTHPQRSYPRYWSGVHALDSDHADSQHRDDVQPDMAGEPPTVLVEEVGRLRGVLFLCPYRNHPHVGFDDFLDDHCQADRGLHAARACAALLHRSDALCGYVGGVCDALRVYAQHPSEGPPCDGSRHLGWCSHATAAVRLHPRTDVAVGLQCYLWLVCRPAVVYVMGAVVVDYLPVWCRTDLHQPESG